MRLRGPRQRSCCATIEAALSVRIGEALQLALRDEESGTAEHLLCALEVLAHAADSAAYRECCHVERDKVHLAIADAIEFGPMRGSQGRGGRCI